MKASEDLRKEHEIVLEALEVLENISNRIDKNEWPEISELREFVDFLIVFADKCHHGKEEDGSIDMFAPYLGIEQDSQ